MPNPQRPLVPAPVARSQLTIDAKPSNEWLTWGYDAERTAWNRAEATLSPANAGNLKVKWSVKLSTPERPYVLATLTAPLVVSGVRTPRGPRSVLYTLGADDAMHAVDADSGRPLWSKAFPNAQVARKAATWLCPNTANATPVVDKRRGY